MITIVTGNENSCINEKIEDFFKKYDSILEDDKIIAKRITEAVDNKFLDSDKEKRALYIKPDFLSPASQAFLAEFIVNQQKENSNFIVKTNSPFFMKAVETRSKETGAESEVEYFKCDEKECHDITGNLQEYYKEISLLFEDLMNREEMSELGKEEKKWE